MENQIETITPAIVAPKPAPVTKPKLCVICWTPIVKGERRIMVLGDQRMHPAHLTCDSLG